MEIMDVYTANKEKTDGTHQRDVLMAKGDYRFVVSVVIFNSQGELLIQQRTAEKHSWPLYWDYAASGAVSAGEQLYEAAERELAEELGIAISLKEVPSRLTVAFEEGWDEIYFIDLDIPVSELRLQEEEVADAKWVTEAEYLALLEEGKFIPYIYGKSIFDLHRSGSEHFAK